MPNPDASSWGEVEREYAYKSGAGQLLLLGVMMVLVAPAAASMGYGEHSGLTYVRGIGLLTPAQLLVAGWAMAIVLLVFGVMMVAITFRQVRRRQRIAFTRHAFIYPEPSSG